MVGKLSTSVLIGCLTLGAGCTLPSALWILPGSTASNLVIVRGKEKGHEASFFLSVFFVAKCSEQRLYPADHIWRIGRRLGEEPRSWPSRIEYGVVPDGYKEDIRAQPLAPGCYVAADSDTGYVAFEVDSSGAVRETNYRQKR